VRWEFKHAVPFIRSREFLWQEGHSAFASKEEADAEVLEMLDIYARCYEELLAVPVTRGRKSEKEKFAGALYTTSIEAYIPCSGRGIQAATSHCLGQNFAKMFNIAFETDKEDKERAHVWQNSWGFTTRSIGVMLMVHGDDSGAVMPPRVAPVQVVIVPIYFKDSRDTVVGKAKELVATLTAAGVRVHLDDRSHKPGFKFNHWEVRGVPLRIELGPKDIEKGKCVVAPRRAIPGREAKFDVPLEGVGAAVRGVLDEFHAALLARARAETAEHTVRVSKWDEFVPALNAGNVVVAPWCDEVECEEQIKKRSGEEARALAADDESVQLSAAAKTLNLPFAEAAPAAGTCCFACGKPAKIHAFLGRSY
jgi:prolyl-tRNA synthetase